jgi:hypothetical protein
MPQAETSITCVDFQLTEANTRMFVVKEKESQNEIKDFLCP